MNQILLSSDVPFLPIISLRAGELTCDYEAGNLRNIFYGNIPVLQKIYSAVRDGDWATVPMEIGNEKIEARDDQFKITYTARYKLAHIDYRAEITIEGSTESEISFTMKGEALSSFLRNRIGLCVQQPLSCKGLPVTIRQSDGHVHYAIYPELISPHQPFLHIQKMQWQPAKGIDVALLFEGDEFETEDQRNWGDSSYKTYGTPASLPRPVKVEAGDKVQQRIMLSVSGSAPMHATDTAIREEKINMPLLGYCKSADRQLLPPGMRSMLAQLPFDNYSVAIDLDEVGTFQLYYDALKEIEGLATRIELIIQLKDGDDKEWELIKAGIGESAEKISRIVLYSKNSKTSNAAIQEKFYPLIKDQFPHIKIGYGSRAYFTELNRQQPGRAPADFVCFGLHSQAHATDNRSLLENLEAYPDIITSAAAFAGDHELVVSPLTFAPRNNPDKHAQSAGEEPTIDVRQQTYFAAYWTILAIQNLAYADAVIIEELYGMRGMIDEQGRFTPLGVLLAEIKAFDPAFVIRRYRNNRILQDGMLLENASGERSYITIPGIG